MKRFINHTARTLLFVLILVIGLLPIRAEAASKTITVSTQKEFEAAQKENSYSTIKISCSNDTTFTVNDGAELKTVQVISTKGKVTLVNNGTVNKLSVTRKANLDLVQNKTVKSISVSAAANVAISGSSADKLTISITAKGTGMTLKSSIPVKLNVYADSVIELEKGAKGSSVKIKAEEAEIELINKSGKSITVTDKTGTKTKVSNGSTKLIKGSAEKDEQPEITPEVTPAVTKQEDIPDKAFWDSMSTDVIYNGLSEDEKDFYDLLRRELDKYLYTTADLPSSGTMEDFLGNEIEFFDTFIQTPAYISDRQAGEVFSIFDFSKYYFVTRTYISERGNLEYKVSGIKIEFDETFKDGKRRLETTLELEKGLKELTEAVCQASSDDSTRLEWLHDKLAEMFKYYSSWLSESDCDDIYDLLTKKDLASDSGYSALFSVLANAAGIDCICAKETVNYCWNVVLINGKWYGIDVAEDDYMGETMYTVNRSQFMTEPENNHTMSYYSMLTDETVKYSDILKKAFAPVSSTTGTGTAITEKKKISECKVDYIYKKLNKSQKQFYHEIDSMLNELLTTEKNYSGGRYDHSTINGVGFGDAFYIIYYEKPKYLTDEEFCQVCETFDFSRYYFVCDYSLQWNIDNDVYHPDSFTITMYSCFEDGKTRAKATKNIQKIVDSWVEEISVATNDTEKRIRLLHDKICNSIDYNYDFSNGWYVLDSFGASAYGPLTGDDSKCTGYASAFNLVANALGIDSLYVSGFSHAWNEVKIGKTWYVLDCTWDDDPKYANGNTYDFYLINDLMHESIYPCYLNHETNEVIALDSIIPKCSKLYAK